MKLEKDTYYTDGSCLGNPGAGGWASIALIWDKEEKCFKTETHSGGKKNTTNNEMELLAAYYSILNSYKQGMKKVEIYTDSVYVVNTINKNWLQKWKFNGWKTTQDKPVKNKEIWEKVYKLIYQKGMCVIMHHVKGHNGNVLNEYADTIARKESENINGYD